MKGLQHLAEERAGDGLREGSQLQDFAEVVGSIFKNQPISGFLNSFLAVDAVGDGIVESDDVGMGKFLQNGGLLFKNARQNLFGVGIVLGGKLDGKIPAVIRGQFDSK
jgi:hypothetical protein